MGLRSSRDAASGDAPPPSRFTRFRRRLHLDRDRHRLRSDPSLVKSVAAEDFAGIAHIEIISAEMQYMDRWFACLSIGERTYRTPTSAEHTDKPIWKSGKTVIADRNGPHVAHLSVFETRRFSKSVLVGHCEIDLLEILSRESEDNIEQLNLLDPLSSSKIVGHLSMSCYVEDPIETEKSFARQLLGVMDLDGDGKLSFSEFKEFINAFGNQVAATKAEELFKEADSNNDGVVDMDELATMLAVHQEEESLISNCPVCGETLGKFDKVNNMIHMTLCFDEGTGNQVMTGGFLTDKQASYGWMFKLSEWAHFSSYDVGLNSGSSASYILVIDRRTKGLIEEIIDGKIILSMRTLYQSKIGLTLLDAGAKEILQSISERAGKQMDTHESAKNIPNFIESFKGQINMDDVKYPIKHFKTFNEFFIRELKHGARPIANKDCNDIAVCAADCRLMAFNSVDESSRFWIKGRKFSIRGLMGTDVDSTAFDQGSLVIFRLAPQDYHRFHFPVCGKLESFTDIPGFLFTVNPIAVNSKYCNVFTENKRVVSIISSKEFGKVAFIAIGATMVGSITFMKKKDDYVQKGDEFGYFSFGGSTVICVFEKDAIEIDKDLLENSRRSLETLVSVGMRLGISKRSTKSEGMPRVEDLTLDGKA